MIIKRLLSLFVLAIFLIVLSLASCSDSPTESDNGDIDTTAAAALIDSANIELGDLMDEMINITLEDADSSFRPGDIDFSGVHSIYELALLADPSNNEAKFGSAFTQLMLFLADDDLNELLDRFKYTYDTLSFNPLSVSRYIPEVDFGKVILPDAVPLATSGFTGLLPAPLKLDRLVMSAAEGDPMISEIQEIIESSFLTKIQSAENKLLDVINDTGFTFEITPEMQGNNGASPIIIDGSDIRVILAGLYSLEAAIHIFLARDLDFIEYSPLGVETAINQNSSFLSLKSNDVGATHMANAKTNILAAETQLENAIDALLAEIGSDQTNQLIKVYPSDQQELIDIKDTLMYYRTYFDGPKELKIIWHDWEIIGYDSVYNWPIFAEVADSFVIDVDISQFFDNPLNNPKSFLPGYTINLEELNDLYKSYADTYFSSDYYWANMDSIYGLVFPNDTPTFSYHLPEDSTSEDFYEVLNLYYSHSIFGWQDLQNWCSPGNTDIGCYYSSMFWEYQSLYEYPERVGVCYSWMASDFSGWNWPDPTFNGLLPTYTNTDIKDLFFENPSSWEQGDCDTIRIDF